MEKASRVFIAIDLKSFYASAECVARGLDPLATHLVVADASRTDKTICLAVTPSLKAYGIPGRARLFEVRRKVASINAERRRKAPERWFRGASSDAGALAEDPSLELDFIIAVPRMGYYMEVGRKVYETYLKWIAPEDIHVYSVDEVFIDATEYVALYGKTPHELARTLIRDVLAETGITATAGIGPNLYLAKVAMDLEAKRQSADADGVRIAELDVPSYRRKYWSHRPLTDFWRVGPGIAASLEAAGLHTMGDVARCSLGKPQERYSEELLYRLFGINAELLIDHAWGEERCTMAAIKAYRPSSASMGSGQVLSRPYDVEEGRVIVREMADQLALDLVERRLVADQLVLSIGYGATEDPEYDGTLAKDRYGRTVPKPAHGSANLGGYTSSTRRVMEAATHLYDRIADPRLKIRRISIVANHVQDETEAGIQRSLFDDERGAEKERGGQEAILAIRRRFGKNAILKGMNFEEAATGRERNRQIGGHKK